MAIIFKKRSIFLLVAILLAIPATFAALTFVAANRIAASTLVQEFGEMTGRRLGSGSQLVINLYPSLTAEVRDIALHPLDSADDRFPVMTAPLVRLSLSLFAALQGEIKITRMALEKPVFYSQSPLGDWQFPLGHQAKISQLIAQLSPRIGPNPDLAFDTLDSQALGIITFSNGTLVLDNPVQKEVGLGAITNLNGKVSWRAGRKNAAIAVTGTWRGQDAALSVQTADIATLLAGADAGINAAFQSALLTTQFDGIIRLLPAPYIDGAFSAATPSVLETAKWQAISVPYDFATLGLSLSGNLKGEADKWLLEDSNLEWGSNKGIGSLSFQPQLNPPLLLGTLDFDSLDLQMLARIFKLDGETQNTAIASDVRISARSATFGALSLNKVAASVQNSNQTNTLDIHNASAFGGTLQMALKRENGIGKDMELRILANDIETKALDVLGEPFVGLPQVRGSFSAILRGPNSNDPTFFDTANGTIKIRLGGGTIAGLNANQLVRTLRKGGFFSLRAKAPSLFSFNEINAEATLANGTLQFAPLHIGLDRADLNLTGAYAIKNQSIALTGTLNLERGHPEANQKNDS